MLMRELLEFNGVDPGRFHARWISGSEAAKFRDTISEVTRIIKALGPMTASIPTPAFGPTPASDAEIKENRGRSHD